jgi:HlyD family secretion protein
MSVQMQPDDTKAATPDEKRNDAPRAPLRKIFIGVGLALVLLVGYGGYGHWRTSSQAAETQDETTNFVPTVRTIEAKADAKPIELSLPGQTAPYDAASITPRATGYVAERFADIGTRVKKGDRLLHIAAPDLDRQLDQAVAQLSQVQAALAQAQAQVDQAQANLKNSNTNFSRTTALLQRGYETVQNRDNQQTTVLSQQATLETSQAGVKVAQANIEAQQATVARLRTLTAFEDVLAPFDGVVTTRNVDTGDLVTADAGTITPLFNMVRDDILRVSVQVPQSAAVSMHDGVKATVTVPQMEGRTFEGRINRSSEALAASSRALTVEVDVQNPHHELRAGLFVNVTFAVPRLKPSVSVPADTLVFNQSGLQVAVVESEDQIHMQQIKIYRDLGKSVELSDGLQGGEQVVVSPPALLAEGSKVKIAPPNKGEEQAAR